MDELERSLRDLLTDERLEVPVPPGAVGAVHDGVRRHRAATRAVFAVSAVVAVLLGVAAVAAGSGLPHKAKIALGLDEHRPTAKPPTKPPSSAPARVTKERPAHVPWQPHRYVATHPLAIAAATPDDAIPPCTTDQLALSANEFQGATGSAAGSIRVTNQGDACGLQGVPVVTGYDNDGKALTSQTAQDLDPFLARPWHRLDRGRTATSLVVVYGDRSACLGGITRFDVSLTAGASPVSVEPAWLGGGVVQPRCGTTTDLLDHYDLGAQPWETGDTTTTLPGAHLAPAVQGVPSTVRQGGYLSYRVRLERRPAGVAPCLPFRERLVSGDGSVVASQLFRLPCRQIRAASTRQVILDMQLYVPTDAAVGKAQIEWQTPTSAPAVSGTSITVTTLPPHCRQGQLRVTRGRVGAAGGSYYDAIVFRNVSDNDCALQGYPGIEFAGSNGEHLPTRADRFSTTVPRVVVLAAHGGTAAATVSGADYGPNGGATPCTTIGGLWVIVPDLRQQVLVADVGMDCQHHHIHVGPVFPGTQIHP